MESSTWDCVVCSTSNPVLLAVCNMCEEPKPQAKMTDSVFQAQKSKSKKISTRNPIQLFSNTQGSLELVKDSLAQVLRNFNSHKRIVTIVAAGFLGTGKSTWLSSLIHYCENEYYDVPGSFEVGHSQVTQTEGLWIYPYPLYLPERDDIQIMLLDMEGTEGIKLKEDAADTKSSSIRLYTLGLMLASVFTIHTNFRLDAPTVETLKQAFMIIKQLQKDIPMEIPEIRILVKDCKEVNTGKLNLDPKTFIMESCELEDSLSALLNITGRPKPPAKFLEALEEQNSTNPFSLLRGSDFWNFNKSFLKEGSSLHKKVPCLNDDMLLGNFNSYVIELSKIINASNYQALFKGSIEKTLIEMIKPIKEDLLDLYRGKANALASTFSVERNLEELQSEIIKLREDVVEYYRKETKKLINSNLEKFDLLKSEEKQFLVMLKSNAAEQAFIFRKMEHSNAKEKKVLEDRILKITEETKAQEKALQTMESTYKNKLNNLESQLDKNNKDYKLKMDKMQQEYNTKLQVVSQNNQKEIQKAKQKEQELQEELDDLTVALRQRGLVYKTKQQQQKEEEERRKVIGQIFAFKFN